MLAIIEIGEMIPAAKQSIDKHDLDNAIQTIGLRISKLARILPNHDSLPELRMIYEQYMQSIQKDKDAVRRKRQDVTGAK